MIRSSLKPNIALLLAISSFCVPITGAFVVSPHIAPSISQHRVVSHSENIRVSPTESHRVPSMCLFAKDNEDDTAAIVKEEKKDDKDNILKQIKDAGVAGSISLFLWEAAFWAISIPVALFGYQKVTGHWPDVSDKEDLSALGASAFAFANAARFALPLRLGLALGTTPWVQSNIVDTFLKKEGEE